MPTGPGAVRAMFRANLTRSEYYFLSKDEMAYDLRCNVPSVEKKLVARVLPHAVEKSIGGRVTKPGRLSIRVPIPLSRQPVPSKIIREW